MAERRMFAKTIVLSDAFLDMPASTRCLYFTLGMLADDDGFVNSPKSIMRQSGASEDDMNLLIAKKFLLVFEGGVIVIKHWRINNYLRSDRYIATKYSDLKDGLSVESNGAYSVSDSGIPVGIPVGIPSIGKDRIGKDSIDNNICAEPVTCLPIKGGKEYPLYRSDVDKYRKLYPNTNVELELQRMREWCLANPSKQKTEKGMPRFISGWFSRNRNEAPQQTAQTTSNPFLAMLEDEE